MVGHPEAFTPTATAPMPAGHRMSVRAREHTDKPPLALPVHLGWGP